jgi:hypothetical protein
LAKVKLEIKLRQLEDKVDQLQQQVRSLQQPVCANARIISQEELTTSLLEENQQYCGQLMDEDVTFQYLWSGLENTYFHKIQSLPTTSLRYFRYVLLLSH